MYLRPELVEGENADFRKWFHLFSRYNVKVAGFLHSECVYFMTSELEKGVIDQTTEHLSGGGGELKTLGGYKKLKLKKKEVNKG